MCTERCLGILDKKCLIRFFEFFFFLEIGKFFVKIFLRDDIDIAHRKQRIFLIFMLRSDVGNFLNFFFQFFFENW